MTLRFLVLFLFVSLQLLGQGNRPNGFGGIPDAAAGGGGTTGSNSNLTVVLDTSRISYFRLENPNRTYDFTDSTLREFQHFDPTRKTRFADAPSDFGGFRYDYAHLGNLGSAHRQLVYQPLNYRGFRTGFEQFDLYRIRTEDIRFYQITQAYTHAFFSQGPAQSDSYFRARFSRNFAGKTNFSIDYRAINNVGAYNYQKARDNSMALGFWIKGSPRYSSYLTYVGTTVQQQNPGGYALPESTQTGDQFNDVFSIPPLNTSLQAVTLHQHREAAYTQFFTINRDSSRRKFGAYHQLRFTSSNYKFSDTNPDADYYTSGQFADERGLRNFITTDELTNTFRLRTFRLNSAASGTGEADILELGLQHRYIRADEERADSTINNLFATARIGFTLSNRLFLQTNGHLGLLANAGDYRVGGRLFLNLEQAGTFEAELVNQLSSPSLTAQRFFVTDEQLWNTDLKKTLGTHLSGTYRLPRFELAAGAAYHLLNNQIYYDTAGIVRQTEAPVNILQLTLEKDFRAGGFHLDNQFTLQTTTNEVLRLPGFYGKHSLYWQGFIFRNKAMLLKVGLDARLVASYRADTYNALIGQFHLQDEVTQPFVPLIDGFVTFRVDKFRFFVRVDNLLPYRTQRFYQLTTDYAQPFGADTGLRLGLSWRFVD